MATFEKRVRQIETHLKPKKQVYSKIWIGDSPKGYGGYEEGGKNWSVSMRNEDWTPADFNEEYEQSVIFLPEQDPKL